jgi:hypothetical protein
VKQIIFINGCLCFFIPLSGMLMLVLEPSTADIYLVAVLLYGALLLTECWSFFFPKQLLFLHGPRFMREIAEYERKKLGRKQDRKGRIGRLVALTFSLSIQLALFTSIRNDDPIHIRNVPGYWTIMAFIVLIFALIGNAAILMRIRKIDKTEAGQFRWFTLKSMALGVILGVVAVALLNVGLGIALN